MHRKQADWKAFALDDVDAFLTMEQVIPTVVLHEGRHYRLHKILPGQRNGTASWHGAFFQFLFEQCQIEAFTESPSLMRNADQLLGLLLHIDDLFGPEEDGKYEGVVDAICSKYKYKIEWIGEVGDCIQFLKRDPTLMRDDLLIIHSHDKNLRQLLELYPIGNRKSKSTPMPAILPGHPTPLNSFEYAKYRSEVGILLYLSPDIVASQNIVRVLAQAISAPTNGHAKLLNHLLGHLCGTANHIIGFDISTPGKGVIAQSTTKILELFADSDWSGSKETRSSISSNAIP